MKIFITEKENIFEARSEQDEMLYQLVSQPTVPTRKLYAILDRQGVKVGEIKRMRNNFGLYNLPRYYVEIDHYEEISLIKDIEQFHTRYLINGNALSLEGQLLADHFSIYIQNEKYADVKIAKRNNSWFMTVTVKQKKMDDLLIGFLFAVMHIYKEDVYANNI